MTRQVAVDSLTMTLLGIGDGVTTTFPFSTNTDPTAVALWCNGVRLVPNAGYNVTNVAIVFDAPPGSGDSIVVSTGTPS